MQTLSAVYGTPNLNRLWPFSVIFAHFPELLRVSCWEIVLSFSTFHIFDRQGENMFLTRKLRRNPFKMHGIVLDLFFFHEFLPHERCFFSNQLNICFFHSFRNVLSGAWCKTCFYLMNSQLFRTAVEAGATKCGFWKKSYFLHSSNNFQISIAVYIYRQWNKLTESNTRGVDFFPLKSMQVNNLRWIVRKITLCESFFSIKLLLS